jgi:hypothetical protein
MSDLKQILLMFDIWYSIFMDVYNSCGESDVTRKSLAMR